ncbi:hypothetical protein AXG93_48s1000 [Marchantia polymorpha subsp. ruderalis]|uniref:Uncharacterized protein n=1 Tax=Marchantia polymorpha subsp. ruderalis TaxID=1480154 RepID=A0A176VWH2_MARPO|nr:hypothetical protein AXG93_48s1000 [Marchantia polymorpha subsp. ruderalis]
MCVVPRACANSALPLTLHRISLYPGWHPLLFMIDHKLLDAYKAPPGAVESTVLESGGMRRKSKLFGYEEVHLHEK